MWKDTEFYSKRDDDSAIGDSEHNSAEEESMNSRRKSSISDDIDEMTIDSHAQLASKLGSKIPECLLKSTDELMENCRKIQKSYTDNKPKVKREIRVLPSAVIEMSRKRSVETIKTSNKENTSLLEAKFQYLLSEMKKLRELDQEILRKFLDLNESVEEVRWKLTEDEEALKRKIAEEAEEELTSSYVSDQRILGSEDDFSPGNTYVNADFTQTSNSDIMRTVNNDVMKNSKITVTDIWNNHEDLTLNKNDYETAIVTPSEIDGIVPSTKTETSPTTPLRFSPSEDLVYPRKTVLSTSPSFALQSNRAVPSPPKLPDSSFSSNPSYATIEVREQSSHMAELKRSSKHRAALPNKELLNRGSSSDIWVVREDFKTSRLERSKRKVARNSIAVAPTVSNSNHTSPNPGNEFARRRRSDITQPYVRGRSNLGACSFRLVADENSRIGRLAQWNVAEQKVAAQSSVQPQPSNHHHNAVEQPRLRSPASFFQVGITKPSESSSSLNSSSSRTSSESSTSAPPPPSQTSLKRSNSNSKWGKFFRRSSKSSGSGLDKNSNGFAITKNNHKSVPMGSKRISDPILRDTNILSVSYKPTPDSSHRWAHNQDDITYL